MDFDNDQIELAMTELGSVLLRLQRAGLTETQSRTAVQRVCELDELPVSCDEKMWNTAEPKGDSSADAVKEGSDDSAPDTVKDPEKKPWDKGEADKDEAPDTVKDPVQKEGWDRFMDPILMSEGSRANRRATDLPDSPGMLHAKRYGEKAHNRIIIKK